jgi:hypothetical protein
VSDNPDIPLGDNCSTNNTSDINDCISIDSDYEGVASLSNSSNNRIYLDNIHMDHIYTQYKGLKVYNGYSYWYLTYDMHQ